MKLDAIKWLEVFRARASQLPTGQQILGSFQLEDLGTAESSRNGQPTPCHRRIVKQGCCSDNSTRCVT